MRRGKPDANQGEPYYQEDGITIYCGDCRGLLPSISADAVVTDPPYGIGMRSHDDSLAVSIDGMNACMADRAIAFMSPRRVYEFVAGCSSWQFRRMLWWYKSADLSHPWRGWYMSSEAICVFDRGGKWDVKCRFHSDLYVSGPMGRKPPHPCWKRVDTLVSLIDHVASANDVVLDPFMGSGPTLVAAKELGRRAIGIEIEERYCEVAAKRLSQCVLSLGVPEPMGVTQERLFDGSA